MYINGELKGSELLAKHPTKDPSSWNIKSIALVSAPPHHNRSYLGFERSPGSPKEGEDYMIL